MSNSQVLPEEGTISSTYADLTTWGPGVDITIGPNGTADVVVSAVIAPTTSNLSGEIGLFVDGIRYSDFGQALSLSCVSGITQASCSASFSIDAQTPGQHTYSLKYKSSRQGTEVLFAYRYLSVTPT